MSEAWWKEAVIYQVTRLMMNEYLFALILAADLSFVFSGRQWRWMGRVCLFRVQCSARDPDLES